MFLGHYGVALGSKKAAPSVSLGTLMFAAQLADLLWPIFLLMGLEHVRIDPGNTVVTALDFYDYPITHSLLGALAWSGVFGALYFLVRRHARAAWVVAAVVFSHWVLDLIVHRPDLPLVPSSPTRVGLGVWNSLPATLVVEFGLYLLGVVLYLRATAARDAVGRYALWALVVLLPLIYLVNLTSPPPPNSMVVAVSALGLWLFVPWGYWIDRHRTSRT
jgi:hypothetical protein